MTERQIPDGELITGSIANDLQNASENGSVDDVMAILNTYETEQVVNDLGVKPRGTLPHIL